MYPFERMPFYGSFVRDEVRALRQAGCDVDVLFINGAQNKLNYFRSPFMMLSALKKLHYDIIHVHHSFCGFIAGFQKRTPVVWTFHEGEIARDSRIIREDAAVKLLAYSRRFKRFVARRMDAVICVADILKRSLGRANAYTLPSGIDTDLFSPRDRGEARSILGIDKSGYCVLFPSSKTRPEKRFGLAKAAVDGVDAKFGAIKLMCLDNVEHEKVPLYINASNLMLMTSSFEASPVTIREALACNVPVISTDVGDARKMLQGIDGCAVVPPDPEKIADAVVQCLQNFSRVDSRDRMMIYSLTNTAKRLLDIYDEILERNKR